MDRFLSIMDRLLSFKERIASWIPRPRLNFIHLHYLYFLITTLIAAAIFWGASEPDRSISFVDSLFFSVSAMTEAGLNTVNLSTLNTFQQVLLFLLILMGSSIWVSAWVVGVRRRAFGGRFRKRRLKIWESEAKIPVNLDTDSRLRNRRSGKNPIRDDEKGEVITGNPVIGRNSNFHHLNSVDRERLCRTEYKAVVFLSWTVPIYFVAWQFLGCLSLGAYINHYFPNVTRENGLNPWWVGAFNCVSAFNNSGMSLLDANMIPFGHSPFILLSMGLFILAGNTCYPVILRLFIWTLWKCLPDNERWSDSRHTLRFLLDHPRRCYTNLFPSQHTWWLLGAVMVLNGIDSIMYVILNIGNDAITHSSPGIEFVDGLFQAFAVRNGGFYVVPIASLRIGLQVLYVIMMYISAYPIAITIRNSNVYEERSLGIYADDPYYRTWDEDEKRKRKGSNSTFGQVIDFFGAKENSRLYFVKQQFRAQLAHDLWWLVLAVWLIMIIETGSFDADPVDFSVFNVIFEVVSGYGTVGISVGAPGEAYSFCGAWHALSKLILCAVMIRGRHRGLPVAIDKAVLLPRENEDDFEEEDARIRGERVSMGDLPAGMA